MLSVADHFQNKKKMLSGFTKTKIASAVSTKTADRPRNEKRLEGQNRRPVIPIAMQQQAGIDASQTPDRG
jgi:hypothetical protein